MSKFIAAAANVRARFQDIDFGLREFESVGVWA